MWSIAAAWLVIFVAFLWVGFNADDPGVPMLMFFIVMGVAVFGLVMIVMRALLRRAAKLQSDMEAVIQCRASCGLMSSWRSEI